MSELSPLGRAALEYAAQGLAVFPLVPREKRPLTSRGFLEATTNADQVRAWWTTSPAANIGAVPASVGCIALDIDAPQHVEAAEALGLFAEPNHEVITGNGRHVWFKHEAPDATALAGIIARSARGYVVMPPSVHPSGAVYATETTLRDARPLPDRAALALVRGDAPASPGARAVRSPGAKLTPGDRHAGLVAEAGRLAAHGLLEHGLAFLQGFNLYACSPPKDADEVTKVWEYVLIRESAKRAEKSRQHDAVDLSAFDPPAPYRPRSLRELMADLSLTRPPRFIVPGLVEEGCVTMIAGAPKAGKSTLASQIAADKSRGRCALDGSDMSAGKVLWIALDEPARRLVQRLPTFDPDPDRFVVYERQAEPLSPRAFAALLEAEDPSLVVIDTLSQLGSDNGIKPNDAEAVAPFMKALVSAVQSRPQCGALFLFHAPHHAQRAAGSVQWSATVDAPLVLRRRFEAVARPGESPDDDDESSAEDGRRVLAGVTRWGGELRLQMTFSHGRYQVGSGVAPVIDRVRWALNTTEAGPELTSAAAITRVVRARNEAVADAIHTLIGRGEARYVGTGRKRYLEPTSSMSLYLGTDGERTGSGGEMEREEKEENARPKNASLPAFTPASEFGKRKDFGFAPAA